MASIKFGTDGWRGVIAEDFTFANARIVAQAIARYAVRNEDARKGLLIGYDHRFASDRIAADLAEVISSTGTPVWLAAHPCQPQSVFLERHKIQSQLWQQRPSFDRLANRKRAAVGARKYRGAASAAK